ncbi:MAG: glycosyltransferase [Deltaproteobacteria bacterium]|nr:glycosyltransferase [Deltaproteobacteria bacterium]
MRHGVSAHHAWPRPARLVFLLQDLRFGGTQRQVLELARALDAARFRVEVWVMMAGADLEPLARTWQISVVRLARQSWVGPPALFNLWRRLKSHPPDLFLLFTVVPNIWGRILGRLVRVPLIVGNCRGGAAPWRQHEHWLWPLSDHLICNCQALKQVLTRRHGVPADRVTVVLNGVDTAFFRPPPGAGGNGPLRVLSLARFAPDKDHETLLRAFALVAQDLPQTELWLVGEGDQQAVLEKMASLLCPPKSVRFFPGRPDVRPLLEQASLLALSSIHEALPNVLLEAMAAGLPVVATKVGGVPEAVGHGQTGWLVPPRDPPALAAALRQLLASPETQQTFGEAGRRKAMEVFSLEGMRRGYEAVLQRLLHSKSGPQHG